MAWDKDKQLQGGKYTIEEVRRREGASHFFACHCECNEVERGNPINLLILKIVGLLRRSSNLRFVNYAMTVYSIAYPYQISLNLDFLEGK
jgi:hypothetical protein